MNIVIVRDINVLLTIDKFLEEFAGYQVASLIDFFSRYDQVELDKQCRDMTAMMTLLGLVRQTTLP